MKSILIVEDDITFSQMLKAWLTRKNFQVDTASTIASAKEYVSNNDYKLILSDMRLPDAEGVDLLEWVIANNRAVPFIIMTSYADIQSAVRSMKLGASDYIEKPFQPDDLLTKIEDAINKAADKTDPKQEPKESSRAKLTAQLPNYIKGESVIAQNLYKYIKLVSPTQLSVLIEGASGTGKEHLAQLIHQQSKRNKAPFIAIDCGALSKELAASEFFGHIKGAFTGALENKTGALVEANGGTVFMDEIGNLSYDIQVQLLRALEERIIRPIGSNQEIPVDIRLVTATNEDLPEAISKGAFREDLYHRINEFAIRVPTLSERVEDIPALADYFLKKSNIELNKKIKGFSPEALTAIKEYSWPGNIRQLKNSIRKATLLSEGDYIERAHVELDFTQVVAKKTGSTIELYDEHSEKSKIIAALKQTNNNKSQAAKLLNIDRKTLYNKLKLYEIES